MQLPQGTLSCYAIHLVKTILKRVQKFKRFIYASVRLVEHTGCMRLEAELRPRSNSSALCSVCKKPAPGYDTLPVRQFVCVPLWGIKVFFIYRPRRVNCGECGVKVEQMPWVKGKSHRTEAYEWFLARWAKRLSWKEVAEAFCTSWESVFRSVERAVNWGRSHQDLSGIQAIGVDEIKWQCGHHYLTLVYPIDGHAKRLLWVGEKRTVKTLLRFFR